MKLVNQQFIKNTNMKRLYSSIYSNSGISRARLAKLSSLSKTTVSSLVDELIDLNFVVDGGTASSECVGRKPNTLMVRTNSHFVIVVSWIENFVYAHLIDVAGTVVYDTQLELSDDDSYISLSKQCIFNHILNFCDPKLVLGICVVVSAMIDAPRGEVYSTTLSLFSQGTDNLIQELEQAFPSFPVAFLEDTACYAYAEKVYSQVKERNFAFVNFGRGIGATLFIEDSMMGKASGSFTQFGHYTVNANGPLCSCGNHGCLEAMFSEQQLKTRIQEIGNIPSLNGRQHITFQDLGKAALFKDPVAITLLQNMAAELAMALSNLICIVNPELIILGGKIPSLGTIFLEEVKKCLKTTGFRKMVDYVTVCYSSLQSDAYLNGAMKYFFDTYYSFPEGRVPGFFIG